MSAHDRAAKARARMDQVRREMAERRALRARKARAAKESATENLKKQGPVAAQVAKHMGELGRRARMAGGWATDRTQRDTDYVMGFGADDDQPKPTYTYRPPPQEAKPGGIGYIEEEPTPTPTPTPTAPPRDQRDILDDEDDFSNQSSWMRKK
jgi:hypothetical protein